jgi:hypothetical protein
VKVTGILDTTVKIPAKQPVYDLADQFCRRLSAAGSRGRARWGTPSWRRWRAWSLVRAAPAGPFAADEQGWLRAYAHLKAHAEEALLLTLSSALPSSRLTTPLRRRLDHGRSPRADRRHLRQRGARRRRGATAPARRGDGVRRVADDKTYLQRHLKAGSFACCCLGPEGGDGDEFDERFPEAAAAWKLLLRVGEHSQPQPLEQPAPVPPVVRSSTCAPRRCCCCCVRARRGGGGTRG